MRKLPILAPLALLLMLSVSACGNKGPLVRPPVEAPEPVLLDEPVEAGAEDQAVEDAVESDAASDGEEAPPADPIPA